MNCPNCGNDVNENQKFCSNCGININKRIPEKNNLNKKQILLMLMSFAVVIASIIIYLCLPPRILLGQNAIVYLSNNQVLRVSIDSKNNLPRIDNKYSTTYNNIKEEFVDLSFDIDIIPLKFSELSLVQVVEIPVLNTKNNHVRIVRFKNKDGILYSTLKIKRSK